MATARQGIRASFCGNLASMTTPLLLPLPVPYLSYFYIIDGQKKCFWGRFLVDFCLKFGIILIAIEMAGI